MSSVFINIPDVFIAALVASAVHALWYSPWLFGSVWTRLQKTIHADYRHRLIVLAAYLLTAYVLAHFVHYAIETLGLSGSITDGAVVGAWAWVGFVATSSFVHAESTITNKELWVIEAGQQLVSLVLIGAIIAAL